MLQTVAAGHDRRAELLHPCVPGLLQRLHFLGGRLGPAVRRFAIDEQELRHDTSPNDFACSGGGPSPALCDYNERAAALRTPEQIILQMRAASGADCPRPPNYGATPDRGGVTAFRASPPHQPPRQVS